MVDPARAAGRRKRSVELQRPIAGWNRGADARRAKGRRQPSDRVHTARVRLRHPGDRARRRVPGGGRPRPGGRFAGAQQPGQHHRRRAVAVREPGSLPPRGPEIQARCARYRRTGRDEPGQLQRAPQSGSPGRQRHRLVEHPRISAGADEYRLGSCREVQDVFGVVMGRRAVAPLLELRRGLVGTREIRTMQTSSILVDKAQQLAAAGRHTEVIAYLGARDASDLDASPDLALLYGTAQARLGRHDEGQRWLDRALDQARKRDAQTVERHALNARGALALVSGRMDEAADFCTRALMAASGDGDLATTGRCSNNLGIISHLRGRHAEAIGSWEIAVAAFERAGLAQGVAECRHNLAITYREQGALDRALAEADRAVAQAEAAGDRTLWAMALRGRAEIRVVRGEVGLARRE